MHPTVSKVDGLPPVAECESPSQGMARSEHSSHRPSPKRDVHVGMFWNNWLIMHQKRAETSSNASEKYEMGKQWVGTELGKNAPRKTRPCTHIINRRKTHHNIIGETLCGAEYEPINAVSHRTSQM